MSDFFFTLMFINLLGIIPFFVVFIVLAVKKQKKAAFGFLALGCLVGTFIFGMIGGVLSPNRNINTKAVSDSSEIAAEAPTKPSLSEILKKNKAESESEISTQFPVPTEKVTETPTQPPTSAPTEAPTLSYEEKLEQYKELCSEISYEDLARNPEKHKGEHLRFRGEVAQVIEPILDNTTTLLVNVTEEKFEYIDESIWTDALYCTITIPKGSDRILEDDIIDIWGECEGLTSYTGLLGQQVSIPEIKIYTYEIEE